MEEDISSARRVRAWRVRSLWGEGEDDEVDGAVIRPEGSSLFIRYYTIKTIEITENIQ